MRYYIGIDTGVHTGVAIWDCKIQQFLSIEELQLHRAFEVVKAFAEVNEGEVFVRYEDATQRRWIPNTGNIGRELGRRMGAGSVRRDSNAWEDALTDWRIPHEAVAPRYNATKMKAEPFRAITHWTQPTNEHKRDAAMLVFGRRA